MKSFNLSDWALEHRSLVWYFMELPIECRRVGSHSVGDEDEVFQPQAA